MANSVSGDVRVRLATAADVPALHALIERGYRGDAARLGWTHEADLLDDERTTVAELAAIVDDPASRMFLFEAERAMAACVHIRSLPGRRCYLGMLCVDPPRQAAGLGKNAIAVAERAAVEQFGATRIEMTVIDRRTDIIAYYERRGYAQTGERRPFPSPDRPELEFVVLEKTLAPA